MNFSGIQIKTDILQRLTPGKLLLIPVIFKICSGNRTPPLARLCFNPSKENSQIILIFSSNFKNSTRFPGLALSCEGEQQLLVLPE
jgi:predicted class III extradiol MEMO1 family dioxygenase